MTDNTFMKKYIQDLFAGAEQESDGSGLGLLRESVLAFVEDESHANATMVYNIFAKEFLCFGNKMLVDLVATMNLFEQRSSGLTEKQRDHYVHSVNVFSLGLAIFSKSTRFKESYSKSIGFEGTRRFIFKWGLASLYHDIGYPIEISYNTIRSFLKDVSSENNIIRPIPCFDNLEGLSSLTFSNGEAFDSLASLSGSVSERLGIPYECAMEAIGSFQDKMMTTGFVDHGFFSALIVMKITSRSEPCASAFESNIIDSARAILLHNFYRHTFIKEPFSLKPLRPESDALSYLLILCDELQEWNRVAYGSRNIEATYPMSSRVVVTDDLLHIEFHTTSRRMGPEFAPEKIELIRNLLDIDTVFSEGIEMVCPCNRSADLFLEELEHTERQPQIPVLFIESLPRIAEMIHNDYMAHMSRTNPGGATEYGGWDSLTDDIKYSNLKQAYGYADKIGSLGLHMAPLSGEGSPIEELDEAEIEVLAILEHDRWVEERRSNGWVYGPVKDVKNRISPYMVSWSDLNEDIRELDRKPMRNIIPFLRAFGIGVFY